MKLFFILQSLNSRQKANFASFLDAEMFNKRQDVQKLLAHWRAEKGRSHPPEIYWQKVYPHSPFSVKKWHLLTSRLFKLLEEFLAIQELQNSATEQKFLLAKAYRKFKKDKLFQSTIRGLELVLEKQPFRNTAFLQKKHDLAYEELDYIYSINRKERTNLQEVSDRSNAYFLATKIWQGCYAVSRKTINQESYEIGFLAEALAFVKTHPDYLEIPAVAVYYYCYQAMTAEENEPYFQQLRQKIEAFQHQFPPSEIRDIYFVAINYCIRKLNTGALLYVREAFELYRLSLEQGYLLEDGIMPESTFGNIVALAIKLKKYAWATNFLDNYQEQLKPAFRQPLFHFSMAKLLYEQGKLAESMREVALVETKAPFLFLGARTLQLKIYYELDEIDLLENLLDSLRVYLQRRKDLGYRRQNYENLLSFTRQLLQVTRLDKKEKLAFQNRVEAADILTEREWILERIGRI